MTYKEINGTAHYAHYKNNPALGLETALGLDPTIHIYKYLNVFASQTQAPNSRAVTGVSCMYFVVFVRAKKSAHYFYNFLYHLLKFIYSVNKETRYFGPVITF